MSIIYDALKKTQDNSQQEKKAAMGNIASNIQERKTVPPIKQVTLAIAGLFLGALLCWKMADMIGAYLSRKNNTVYRHTLTSQTLLKPIQKWLPQGKSSGIAGKTFIKPTHPAQGEMPYFTLEGILLSNDKNTALINGKICNIGDTIDGASVEEISADQVVLLYKNERRILRNK